MLIDLPENATDIYESLRNQILKGTARPDGLSVILYHGVLNGLQILGKKSINQVYHIAKPETNLSSEPPDAHLVQLLASMILHKQSEILHVY